MASRRASIAAEVDVTLSPTPPTTSAALLRRGGGRGGRVRGRDPRAQRRRPRHRQGRRAAGGCARRRWQRGGSAPRRAPRRRRDSPTTLGEAFGVHPRFHRAVRHPLRHRPRRSAGGLVGRRSRALQGARRRARRGRGRGDRRALPRDAAARPPRCARRHAADRATPTPCPPTCRARWRSAWAPERGADAERRRRRRHRGAGRGGARPARHRLRHQPRPQGRRGGNAQRRRGAGRPVPRLHARGARPRGAAPRHALRGRARGGRRRRVSPRRRRWPRRAAIGAADHAQGVAGAAHAGACARRRTPSAPVGRPRGRTADRSSASARARGLAHRRECAPPSPAPTRSSATASTSTWWRTCAPTRPGTTFPLGDETERTRFALELAGEGREVALISSGDPGIYAMATLAMELLDTGDLSDAARRVDVRIVPGVSAAQAAAARVGAPLGHDFAFISLSDLMTPWPAIARRLHGRRRGRLRRRALQSALRAAHHAAGTRRSRSSAARAPATTPVILAASVGRAAESIRITTLAEFDPADGRHAVDRHHRCVHHARLHARRRAHARLHAARLRGRHDPLHRRRPRRARPHHRARPQPDPRVAGLPLRRLAGAGSRGRRSSRRAPGSSTPHP